MHKIKIYHRIYKISKVKILKMKDFTLKNIIFFRLKLVLSYFIYFW